MYISQTFLVQTRLLLEIFLPENLKERSEQTREDEHSELFSIWEFSSSKFLKTFLWIIWISKIISRLKSGKSGEMSASVVNSHTFFFGSKYCFKQVNLSAITIKLSTKNYQKVFLHLQLFRKFSLPTSLYTSRFFFQAIIKK